VKKIKLSDSGARGWFIGDFPEAVFHTKDFEVNYQINERRQAESHIHKIVTEIQLVISGKMLVSGEIFEAGDICILEPGDISQIEYLETTATVAVKAPSIPSDKYLL
jgi:hypothetical protein